MSKAGSFVLHGAAAYSESKDRLITYESAYVVCEDGIARGVFREIPEKFREFPVTELGEKLILPGMVDLHVHAPQYAFHGTGFDLQLIDWLDRYTYPEEMKYKKKLYAERSYDLFVEDLYCGASTRAVIFATRHVGATVRLMELLDETGLVTYVGKVNMDRNVPEGYCETTEESLLATEKWLARCEAKEFQNTMPILTPRFTPTCTRALMDGLGKLSAEFGIPVQSHLSENLGEIEWVKNLEPDSAYYGETYDRCGLFGTNGKTIMAHCVHSGDEEVRKMKENGVFIAHCPQSNMNLMSGAAPVRRYLDQGMRVGLGSDVAGGAETSMFTAMKDAVHVSKMRFALSHPEDTPLTLSEVFYMATMGGGEFFGRVGSFMDGYEFDAVILDDTNIATLHRMNTEERLERAVYCADDRNIVSKYVRGKKLY
ncbi:MAG: amidohydrolase family protein [Lachnospiraceae bacterium]|nr:amidohydrolase family protein [Lachnospiraceae bacterium]